MEEPICWLQCPKCKKQSKFKLRDIVQGKPAQCRLCQTPMEINRAALDEARQNLASMFKATGEEEDKGPSC